MFYVNMYDARTVHLWSLILIRAVESERREVRKSLKIGKNRIRSEKNGFHFLLDFLAKMQNAIKCQNACTSGQGPASEYLDI